MSPEATYDQQNIVHNGPGCPAGLHLNPVDLAAWDDGDWARPIFWETNPVEPNEPWPYRFKSGDSVWVRASDGVWYQGKIVGQAKKGKTRFDDGLWWCVEFTMGRVRIRKWVAPLNGDVKPDDDHMRWLLCGPGCPR